MSKRLRVPLGKALDTPPEELDMAALITPEDREAAQVEGRQNMRPTGRALLDTERAAPQEDGGPR